MNEFQTFCFNCYQFARDCNQSQFQIYSILSNFAMLVLFFLLSRDTQSHKSQGGRLIWNVRNAKRQKKSSKRNLGLKSDISEDFRQWFLASFVRIMLMLCDCWRFVSRFVLRLFKIYSHFRDFIDFEASCCLKLEDFFFFLHFLKRLKLQLRILHCRETWNTLRKLRKRLNGWMCHFKTDLHVRKFLSSLIVRGLSLLCFGYKMSCADICWNLLERVFSTLIRQSVKRIWDECEKQ